MSAKGAPLLSRRDVVQQALAVHVLGVAVILSGSSNALAEPQELQSVGRQAPAPDGETPFVSLENGVKIKVYKEGTGSDDVKPGSRVSLQCSGRLLNLNGVIFYNTKNNNPDGFGAIPLTFTIGKGEAVPGLESGVLGMKKNEIRRIIVPAELAYSKYPDLEPRPMSREEQLALDSVVKNPRRDATILFDVQVERFK
jgi:peptidylprolyl isomerase